MTQLIGVQRRFMRIGKVRTGELEHYVNDKGEKKTRPKKLSTFRFTSASESILEAVAETWGGTVRPWVGAPEEGFYEVDVRTLAVRQLYEDGNAPYARKEVKDVGGALLPALNAIQDDPLRVRQGPGHGRRAVAAGYGGVRPYGHHLRSISVVAQMRKSLRSDYSRGCWESAGRPDPAWFR